MSADLHQRRPLSAQGDAHPSPMDLLTPFCDSESGDGDAMSDEEPWPPSPTKPTQLVAPSTTTDARFAILLAMGMPVMILDWVKKKGVPESMFDACEFFCGALI
jgi:hypothetical protein